MKGKSFGFLSGNALKIIAAVSMLIDHIGFIFYPNDDLFRILGRLAFPIFSFFIAVGCKYTKNPLRYFLQLALLGIGFQAAAYSFTSSVNIFITFSFSILIILPLNMLKTAIFKQKSVLKALLWAVVTALSVAICYAFCQKFNVDYGFAGCLVPVAASIFMLPKGLENTPAKKFEKLPLQVLMTGIAILYVWHTFKWVHLYSLLSLPLLLLYSGKRGKLPLKYFFYVFYPAHLVLLYGIYEIIYHFK